jgi:riboflavin synthase
MDVSPETIRVSALGSLKRGDRVNLERPMRADARVGGHFVQGHVDATGTIEEIRSGEDYWWVTVKFPPSLAAQIVRKGSIAVDGISLTVAGVDDRRFDVQIVPYTWEHTNLQFAKVNDLVNLEFDMIGKYVLRALEVTRAGSKA